jgi:hypothetical protein
MSVVRNFSPTTRDVGIAVVADEGRVGMREKERERREGDERRGEGEERGR